MSKLLTKRKVTLRAEELNIAKANMTFALANCPVENLTAEIHGASDIGDYQRLLERFKAVRVKPTNKIEVGEEEFKFLQATAEYALKNCEIDAGIPGDAEEYFSREQLSAWLKKLKSLQGSLGGSTERDPAHNA